VSKASSLKAGKSASAVRALLLCVVVLVAVAATPSDASATPHRFWQKCEGGSTAGQCSIPRGIASSPIDGTVYLADQNNRRVNEFTTWGVFIRTFGWKVNQTKVEAAAPEAQQNICPVDPGDVCQAGESGSGAGQFAQTGPQGIAVDSAGNVYAVDRPNHRVQKFDSEGHFLLMFGGQVNKTKVEAAAPVAQQNICPVDPGDVCQEGTEGTGPGQFGEWPVLGSYIAIDTKTTASVADDVIYVGDVGRIQKFGTDGASKGNLPNPEGVLTGKTVTSLAVVPVGSGAGDDGELFATFASTPNAFRIVGFTHPPFPAGARVCETEGVTDPKAVAADTEGNFYVVDGTNNPQIRKFGSFCGEKVDVNFPFKDGFQSSTGIGTGSACLTKGTDLYVSNSDENAFVRAYGPEPDKTSPPECLPEPHAPEILAQYAVGVGTANATLRATINPVNWKDTTYFAQYGTAACIDASDWEGACVKAKPVPPALLGAGGVDEGVSTADILLEGLAPGTSYRFRFVAESGGDPEPVIGVGGKPGEEGEEGEFTTYDPLDFGACPNDEFRVGPSAALPDCRAYEMVSPVDKNGGDIIAALGIELNLEAAFRQAAVDGNKLTYTSTSAFGDAVRGTRTSQYLATRGASGWASHGLNPPQLTTICDPGFSPQYDLNTNFQAFTPDLSFALLRDQNLVPLSEDGITGYYPNIYLRDNATDTYEALTRGEPPTLENANCDEKEKVQPQARAFSPDLSHIVFSIAAALASTPPAASGTNLQVYDSDEEGQLHLVSVLPNGEAAGGNSFVGSDRSQTYSSQARDSNLSRAVSEDGSRIFWTGSGKVYVRIDGSETVPVSTGTAEFWTADPEGNTAIYSEGGKLFSFDVDTETRSEIADGLGGVVGVSEDLDRLYFTSTEAITGSGQNSEEEEAKAGEWNLYLRQGGTMRFIATVAAADRGEFALDARSPNAHSSRVTPDGEGLTFMSTRPLTGFDNSDADTEEPTSEVFVYDAGTGQLSCASCNPAGGRPEGRILPRPYNPFQNTTLRAAAWIPTWEWTSHANRSLSESGGRLFFNSFDALVPEDTNGAQDVYQWEAPGTGGCHVGDTDYFTQNEGCIDLISTGRNGESSQFIDASADGHDVFFSTASNIAPADLGFIDIYDAREGGGFPPPPPPPPPCEGDACQNIPAPPPVQTPATSVFRGPGNEPPKPRKRCGKGKRKVQRKGKVRCVAKRHHRRADRNRRAAR
jgi:uncharacterized OsmC-like protein